jgi:hypothetical protein
LFSGIKRLHARAATAGPLSAPGDMNAWGRMSKNRVNLAVCGEI